MIIQEAIRAALGSLRFQKDYVYVRVSSWRKGKYYRVSRDTQNLAHVIYIKVDGTITLDYGPSTHDLLGTNWIVPETDPTIKSET
jgi:hypothetical protein